MLSPVAGFLALGAYFLSLVTLSFYRSRKATLDDYYIGSRNSTWWLITLGMISDSVSGVTYVSVPGSVSTQAYSYMQVVFGYFLGYLIITTILLPLYYKRNLISIYSYLGERFGPHAQKTGSMFFIASRTFGSAARLYISVMVLHQFLLGPAGLSPVLSFVVAMGLIVLYTYKGGIKALVWTEAYQSVILLAAIFILAGFFWNEVQDPIATIMKPQIFFTDPKASNFFLKQIFGGMLITSAMNGLDQNIMQLNLSCKRLWDAQKNMITLAFTMVAVNFFFLALGALAIQLFQEKGIALPTLANGAVIHDQVLSTAVFSHLEPIAALIFIVGLAAATFSSAGTILPAIASSIEIDLFPKEWKNKIPVRVIHALAAVLILIIILGIYKAEARSLIDIVLRCSGYTYGPLIGLYGLGIFTKIQLKHQRIPYLCLIAVAISAYLDWNSANLFGGYKIGVELIAVNAIVFTVLALVFARTPTTAQ
ncbi:MAG: sodium:solute symporter [Bdellovibrionales bacterium]|nr:sodium:solute symporter [Bdellovibrionales bacterium]